jgi:hypothetical protein
MICLHTLFHMPSSSYHSRTLKLKKVFALPPCFTFQDSILNGAGFVPISQVHASTMLLVLIVKVKLPCYTPWRHLRGEELLFIAPTHS